MILSYIIYYTYLNTPERVPVWGTGVVNMSPVWGCVQFTSYIPPVWGLYVREQAHRMVI